MNFIEFSDHLISTSRIISVRKGMDGNPIKGFKYWVQIYVDGHPFPEMREYDSEERVGQIYEALRRVLK